MESNSVGQSKTRLKLICSKVSACDAILLAKKRESRRMLSNKELDNLLVEAPMPPEQLKGPAVWSGDILVYVVPGKEFGQEIALKCIDEGWGNGSEGKRLEETWKLQVPARFTTLKDSALLIPYNCYDLEVDEKEGWKSKERQVRVHLRAGAESSIAVVEEFPPREGLYLSDPNTGIPVNKTPTDDQGYFARRYLMRRLERIGLVARGPYIKGDDGEAFSDNYSIDYRYVNAACGPFDGWDVVVATESMTEERLISIEEAVGTTKRWLKELEENVARSRIDAISDLIRLFSEDVTEEKLASAKELAKRAGKQLKGLEGYVNGEKLEAIANLVKLVELPIEMCSE